jgi:alpha-L-rhamnosidase
MRPSGKHWLKANSRSHVGLGVIGEWFLSGLAGIQCDPAKPGFRHAVVRPYFPPEMDCLSAGSESVRGRIAVA